MKKFIVAAVAALTLLLPAYAFLNVKADDGVYTAVFFACQDKYKNAWNKEKDIDLFYDADSWSELPTFIEKVKKEAGNQNVVIDIDSHGDVNGLLYLEDKGKYIPASVGYVLKNVSKVDNLDILLFEACFAAYCYKQSKVTNEKGEYMASYFEPWKTYTLGTVNHSNFYNGVYSQWVVGDYVYADVINYWEYDKFPELDENLYSVQNSLAYYFAKWYQVAKLSGRLDWY